MTQTYNIPIWENDKNFTYLGTDKSPTNGRKYDFWIYKNPYKNLEATYSFIARYGHNLNNYMSMPSFIAWINFEKYDWPMLRAIQLGLYYLVTNETPQIKQY